MAADFIDKQIMIVLFIVVLFFNAAVTVAAPSTESNESRNVDCDENGDCLSSALDCHKICGCDRSAFVAVYYNETSKSCVVSFKHLMMSQINIYGNGEEETEGTQADAMAERIRVEADRIFNTILISVILFLTCCAICLVSACLYCCRITYTDYTLKKDIKALAKKLKRDNINFRKPTMKKKEPAKPISDSCNVVCEDAGVFVV